MEEDPHVAVLAPINSCNDEKYLHYTLINTRGITLNINDDCWLNYLSEHGKYNGNKALHLTQGDEDVVRASR